MVVEVKPLSLQARNGAPIVVDWTLSWTGKGVLEGDLEFSAFDDDGNRSLLLATFRVPDLVLSNMPQPTRLMLPPLEVRGALALVTLRARFVAKEHVFPLTEQVVMVPGREKRAFTIAIANPWEDVPSPGLTALVQHGLQFERFDPVAAGPEIKAVTVPNWIAPEDFPRDPHMLCTFDLVVLVDDGLVELRQEPLDAIVEWIDAGGSAFIRPGELLQPRHVEFLNALAGLDGHPAGFRLDPDRKLVWPDGWNADSMKLHRKGLGRVAIAPRPTGEPDLVPQAAFDTPEWREAVWFLWRFRKQLRAGMVEQGHWRGQNIELGNGPPQLREGTFRPNTFAVQPLQSGNWLLERLIPESVQLVPLWVVACVLALFVVVVGPIDYVVLGLFRLRKLTWVVFPVVTLAFAWFTVWLSNRYMQTSEQHRSLVILDVGDRGRIVRSNELKLYFANTSRQHEIEVTGEVLTMIDHRRFGAADGGSELSFDPRTGLWTDGRGSFYTPEQIRSDYNWRSGPLSAIPDADRRSQLVAPPEYTGRPPTHYSVSERLPQWTPHLHRRFRIRPEGEFLEFEWDAVQPRDLSNAAQSKRLRELVATRFNGPTSIAVLHRGTWQVVSDGALLFSAGGPASPDGRIASRSGESFLSDLCVRPERQISHQFNQPGTASFGAVSQTGLFSLVSQIAPTGGDNFEDLALLDPTDDQQWLLLVAVRNGNDWHLYRKLYVGE